MNGAHRNEPHRNAPDARRQGSNPPVLHRPYLLDAGEGLLLTRPTPADQDAPTLPGLVKTAERREQFLTDTHLAPGDVMAATIVATPLPDYSRIRQGRRRWEGLSPAMMWHPLMWLPERLALPYALIDSDIDDPSIDSPGIDDPGAGGSAGVERERLESPTELAIRVALELTSSGMYDPVTGGWVDVLDLFGLDITTPAVQERVRAWLDGAPDEDLDRIDLSGYIDNPDEPDWAVHVVAELFDDLIAATWHLVALDLAGALTTLDGATTEAILARLSTVTTIATSTIGDAVMGLDLSLGQRLSQITAALPAFTTGTADPQALLDGPVTDTATALRVVARAYRPALELLDSMREEEPGAA
ncbi:hypothetical protein GCG21_08600 [Pseudactinotalea sp. HY160]|uniref:hypothetical protein n=1 Tax=Pseudactinotalea sp. HY160 TaxID=2654490 RepID=UPI00128D0185|nr:hypothetical protein [Pseudactinotalea sp. HY160]MPV50063.1 hypothetical protein [Pseudactinotalea sp. HY160]